MAAPLPAVNAPPTPRRRFIAPASTDSEDQGFTSVPPVPPIAPQWAATSASSSLPDLSTSLPSRSKGQRKLTVQTSRPYPVDDSSCDTASRSRPRPLPRVPMPVSLSRAPSIARPLPQTPVTAPCTIDTYPMPSPVTPGPLSAPDAIPRHLLPPRDASMGAKKRQRLRMLHIPDHVTPASSDFGVSPISPALPSPATRRNRSASKLQRFLGQEVPYAPPYMTARPLPRLAEERDDLAFHSGSATSSSEDEPEEAVDHADEEGSTEDCWTPVPLERDEMGKMKAFANRIFFRPVKRESKHWYHEKGGKLVEQDYEDVVRRLRQLR